MNQAKRTNVGLTLCFLVLGCAIPSAAQNDIVCSTATACKAGAIPLFATDGGSAQVRDSIVTQSGGAMKVAGGARASGDITAGGDLNGTNVNATGNVGATNVNVTGNVGASTVTTTSAASGVSATITGTSTGRIAAVEGSATATGAAGFTFGVIGQSASDEGRGVFGLAPGATGVGVIGETTGSAGLGVVGKTLNGQGWAFGATGNAQQDRGSGGWVKAMVSVNGSSAPYKILHCYNSTLPGSTATTPPCGINLTEVAFAQYVLDFGFEVDDRFFTVSAEPFYVGGDNGAIIADAWAASVIGNTNVEVDLYTNGGSPQTTNFILIVF